jgi:hypothetical protein
VITTREVCIKNREPRTITDGLVISQEAFLAVDTSNMRQEFVLMLHHYIERGQIKVRVAEVVQ